MLGLKNILSLILFCIFLGSYVCKLVLLYKKDKIQANVLAKGKKDKKIKIVEITVKATTFIWGTSWFAFSLGEPYFTNMIGSFTYNLQIGYIGIAIISTGLIVFILAMISMKSSWRVGIDKNTRSELITAGVYKYSRNPAFVGFDMMFLGLFITYPNIVTLLILSINILSIHFLILQEEKHLVSAFGRDYISYSNRTKRYI